MISIKKTIKEVKNVFKILTDEHQREKSSDEEKKRRLSICGGCKSRNENHPAIGDSCGTILIPSENTCGCKLEWKAGLIKQQCEQNKW